MTDIIIGRAAFGATSFFDDLHLSMPVSMDLQNGFLLKTDTDGNAVSLWHLESDNYLRVTDMAINPANGNLTVTGFFRQDITFNDLTLESTFGNEGFLMEINANGNVNWVLRAEPSDEFSSAGGSALGIDSQGNIYAAFSTFGSIAVGDVQISGGQENIGTLIVKTDQNGEMTASQHWIGTDFESFVDVTHIEVLSDDRIAFGGDFNQDFSYADEVTEAGGAGVYAFLIAENADLEPLWGESYTGAAVNLNDMLTDDGKLLVSFAYNNNISINETEIFGTGTWRETAVALFDADGQTEWVKNFTLTQFSGNNSISGVGLTKTQNRYWVGGLYQDWAEHEGEIILTGQNPEGSDFQMPFLMALDKQGNLQTAIDFIGSQGPSLIQTITSDGNSPTFGGEFATSVRLGGTTLQTVNSTLFYGQLAEVTDIAPTPAAPCDIAVRVSAAESKIYITGDAYESAEIYDAAGRKTNVVLQENTEMIDVRGLAHGVYFLRLQCENCTRTFPIIR